MAQNTFGTLFKVTTFGESHGAGLGCIIDGVPAGLKIDMDKVQQALDRRKPGAAFNGQNNAAVTSRKEDDKVEVLSGIFEGISEGTPIALLIRNTSQHSKDYSNLKDKFRPGHADYTFYQKYGYRDYRGGGRSSGRETAARVAAGEIARQVINAYYPVKATAYTERACGISCEEIDFNVIETNPMRCADSKAAAIISRLIEEIRRQGDSTGGIVACKVTGVPAGWGECVFGKLDALLAHAVMSIGAVKGIEIGSGFDAAESLGSENNDSMRASKDGKSVIFETNNAGGILGGMSNGNDIDFRVAVKPVPSIFKSQKTVKALQDGTYADCDLVIEGRHDVCLCPRIIPVIEAMTYITLADLMLQNKSARI